MLDDFMCITFQLLMHLTVRLSSGLYFVVLIHMLCV